MIGLRYTELVFTLALFFRDDFISYNDATIKCLIKKEDVFYAK